MSEYKSLCERLSEEITRLRAENERLRAALANSELPCVYCTLPKEEWGKCEMGFPGCGRADDAMGCPELGARMEANALRADLSAVTAERNRMQHRLDAAYNVIDKDIKNDMAFAKKHADLWLENERLREALRPLAAITLWTDKYPDGPLSVGDNQRYIDPQWIVRARAALEGVTEPPTGDSNA